MGRKLNKLKKIRIHREGTHTLIAGAGVLLLFNACLYYAFECKLPFYISATVCTVIYLIVVNFFRCPVRRFEGDTENVVVAPADGKIVVIEEVDENEYFHDRRLMVSIFMSLTNVHANWIPVDGTVRLVEHHDGNFHKAWLPKASIENERSTIVIETPDGVFIMARQIAGAMARRMRDIRPRRRRLLYRRTHGIHQVRFQSRPFPSGRDQSQRQIGAKDGG